MTYSVMIWQLRAKSNRETGKDFGSVEYFSAKRFLFTGTGQRVGRCYDVSLVFSKFRAFLRATHPHAGTYAFLKKRSIAEQKIKPKEGVKNKTSTKLN